jgi:signal recognition particle GTPase
LQEEIWWSAQGEATECLKANVIMVVGVNGVTTIANSHSNLKAGYKVVLGAGDTFALPQ